MSYKNFVWFLGILKQLFFSGVSDLFFSFKCQELVNSACNTIICTVNFILYNLRNKQSKAKFINISITA